MGTNNVLNQLTFSENSPVKTMLLQQEHFGLVRIALGKGVKIPPHQGGHAVFRQMNNKSKILFYKISDHQQSWSYEEGPLKSPQPCSADGR